MVSTDQCPRRTLGEAEQAIVRYLLAHPDFFNRHPDLVETLCIPHPCRPAVSLLEHQVSLLRERNTQLRNKLEEWVAVARDNSRLIARLQRLTLVLIEARALSEMLQGIEAVLRDEFKAEFTLLRLTARVLLSANLSREVILTPAVQALFEPLLQAGRPLCGRLTRQRAQALFGEMAAQVASVALVPLQGNGWQGLLAVGSQDKERFHPTMGTSFLSCMGELISHALQTHLRILDEPRSSSTYLPQREGSD